MAQALADALATASIDRLEVNHASLQPAQVETLLNGLRGNTTVTALDLGSNPLRSDGLAHLATLLPATSALQRVGLMHVEAEEPGLGLLLAAAGRSNSLTALDLSENPLGMVATVGRRLADALAANEKLCALQLGRTAMGGHLVPVLEQLRRGQVVQSLGLASCRLDPDEAGVLCRLLADSPTLQEADLSSCGGAAGSSFWPAVAEALAASAAPLTSLRLRNCHARPAVLRDICAALGRMSTLKSLDLGVAAVTPEAISALLGCNSTLTSLALDDCELSACTEVLATALSRHTGLRRLSMAQCWLGPAETEALLSAATSLEWIDLAGSDCPKEPQVFGRQLAASNFSLCRIKFWDAVPSLKAVTSRNRRFQADRRRIQRSLSAWRTAINVGKYKRYLQRKR